MTARTSFLAAVAAAAVPGLRPVRVEEAADRVGERFRVAFVEDDEDRRWVVRLPGDAVAAALQDESAALLHLLAPRVPFAVPLPQGVVALRDGRRAVVYPLIEGRPIAFGALHPGPGLAGLIGRAVATIHDLDRRLFEEADVPDYDADQLRTRRQVDLDRGAATGLVPTGLLARWERMLDDVALWRFAPTPVHGRLDDSHLLFRFDDPSDADRAAVAGVTSWENAHVGDPAQDLAELLRKAPPEAFDSVWEAYCGARSEPADTHLLDRARLLGELRLLTDLLAARNLGDRQHVAAATQALRALDDVVSAPGTSGNRSGTVADRLPVDFAPAADDADLYRAGTPTPLPAVHADEADMPATEPVDRRPSTVAFEAAEVADRARGGEASSVEFEEENTEFDAEAADFADDRGRGRPGAVGFGDDESARGATPEDPPRGEAVEFEDEDVEFASAAAELAGDRGRDPRGAAVEFEEEDVEFGSAAPELASDRGGDRRGEAVEFDEVEFDSAATELGDRRGGRGRGAGRFEEDAEFDAPPTEPADRRGGTRRGDTVEFEETDVEFTSPAGEPADDLAPMVEFDGDEDVAEGRRATPATRTPAADPSPAARPQASEEPGSAASRRRRHR